MVNLIGGCTKYIQPGDVVWNRSFKARIAAEYDTWIAQAAVTAGDDKEVHSPSFECVCNWISTAWSSIPKDMIANGFRACGITIDHDGADDHHITCFKLPDFEGAIQRLSAARRAPMITAEPPEQKADDLDFNEVQSDNEPGDDDLILVNNALDNLDIAADIEI